jgi:hypothetical protein
MILNFKLEEPFNKSAANFELMSLSHSVVQSKLSSKFYKEISMKKCDENIQEFFDKFLLTNGDIIPKNKNLKENKQLIQKSIFTYFIFRVKG